MPQPAKTQAATRLGRRSRVLGVSLIEMLISVAIGMVIVSALVALYTGTTGSNALAKAQTEMNEDAQFALRFLSNQIRQTGYNPIQPNSATKNTLPGSLPIFACTNGFANATNALATNPTLLTCNSTAAAGGHGLVITYEADTRNTKPTAGGVPTNCLGSGLTQQTDLVSGRTFYTAENRFYVKNNQLYCAGGAGTTDEQPLAENVEKLEVSFGTAHPTNGTRTVAGYLTPTELGPASGGGTTGLDSNLTTLTPQQRWEKVVTVRLCLVMRSPQEVLPDSASYWGCDVSGGSVTSSSDRFLRRAYVTTIALRNRMATP